MEPYIGEIRMFAGNYAPEGWAFCNGSLIVISENEALFSLIGTIYGGDGINNFKLPDLRGRVPIHTGRNASTNTNYTIGKSGGTEIVTLTNDELTAHHHQANAYSDAGNLDNPNNALWAQTAIYNNYSIDKDSAGKPLPLVSMNDGIVSAIGNNEAHDNMMPSFTISFIIALQGLYPDLA